MSKPNSLTTLLRRRLARIIEPLPPAEEIWCNDCELNQGRTLALHSSVALEHLRAHTKRLNSPDQKDKIHPYVNMIGRTVNFNRGL